MYQRGPGVGGRLEQMMMMMWNTCVGADVGAAARKGRHGTLRSMILR